MSYHTRSLLYLAALLLALSLCRSWATPVSDSTQSSSLPEPLWQMLLSSTGNLPAQIEAYETTWTLQIMQLRANNAQLLINNNSLTLENADLMSSLRVLRADLATLSSLQESLQRALLDSTQSITRAQAAARALEFENGLLKVGCFTLGVVAIAGVVHMGGRALRLW